MKVLMLLILFIFSFSTFAVQGYLLDMNLLLDNKSVSKPKMIVQEGKKATITQNDSATNIITEISIVALRGEIQGRKGILLKMEVGYHKNNMQKIVSRPQILVSEGKEALVEIVGDKGNQQMSLKIIATSVL